MSLARALTLLIGIAVLALALRAPREPPSLSIGPHSSTVRVVAPRTEADAREIDVSRATLPQAEVAVTVDPRNGNVLLAASNSAAPTAEVYGSADGGASWTSEELPAPPNLCAYGDPAVGIAADARQYVAFLAGSCTGSGQGVSLALATRLTALDPWASHRVNVQGESLPSDKEALAVDTSPSSPRRGRLYVAWSRFLIASNSHEVVISHSDDAGETWSAAVKVSPAHAVVERSRALRSAAMEPSTSPG